MSFCPHCHSGVDPVLKDTTWSCGVRFNDALWRTKECYKRQIYVGDEHLRLQEQHISELEEENGRLKQRIKRLEEASIAAIHEAVHGREDDALEILRKAK